MTIKIHTFPNGFRLIHEKPKSKLPITSIHTFCDLGSVYENDDIRGVSHFIEHMTFKGTKKIPKAKDIFTQYDKIGAYFNAYTVERYTCYTIKCNDDYVENSIDIVSDMMMNSVFNRREYNKEYKVVVEESISDENEPEDLIQRLTNKLLYNGSSYENPVDCLAYHKNKGLKYEDVLEIYKTFYRPDRMILSVVSNIPFETIKKMLKQTFFMNRSSGTNIIKYPMNLTITPQSDIQYKIEKKSGILTTLLTVGFRTCNMRSPHKYALNLLKHILVGGMSGRLFMILREKNGLTYSSDVDTTYHEHMGDFTISTECDYHKMMHNGKSQGVFELIVELLNDLLKHGVTQEELDIAKGFLQGHMSIKMEDNDIQCEYNGKRLLLFHASNGEGDGESKGDTKCDHTIIVPYHKKFETYYANIRTVDVNRVIRTYLKRENMNICMVGEHVPTLASVKKACSFFAV